MSEPVAGNHNDLYDIEVQFEVVMATLEQADIPVEGLLLDADANSIQRTSENRAIKRISTPIYASTSAMGTRTGTSSSTKTYMMNVMR